MLLFSALPRAKLAPTIVTFGSATHASDVPISVSPMIAYWGHGVPEVRHPYSLKFLNSSGFDQEPNTLKFLKLRISACEKGGQWQMALQLFHTIPRTWALLKELGVCYLKRCISTQYCRDEENTGILSLFYICKICTHSRLCTYKTCMCMHMIIHTHTHMCIYIYVCICILIYIHTYIHAYGRTYICLWR